MKTYLPNMRSIKSFTEHDTKDIHWQSLRDPRTGEPLEEWCFCAGRVRRLDDFLETKGEAISAATQMRIEEIDRLEALADRLRKIHRKAGN